jgi:hypothetical protein
MSDTDGRAKRETAYHEAGHVVVAWLEGVQNICATIIPDGTGDGRVTMKSFRAEVARAAYLDGGPGRAWALRLLSREMRICLAGYAAENIASGRRGLARSLDDRRARQYATTVLDDDTAADDVLTYEWPHVVRYLRARWSFVEKVALALLDRQTLDAAEIAKLLDELPKLRRTRIDGIERLLAGRQRSLLLPSALLSAKPRRGRRGAGDRADDPAAALGARPGGVRAARRSARVQGKEER